MLFKALNALCGETLPEIILLGRSSKSVIVKGGSKDTNRDVNYTNLNITKISTNIYRLISYTVHILSSTEIDVSTP